MLTSVYQNSICLPTPMPWQSAYCLEHTLADSEGQTVAVYYDGKLVGIGHPEAVQPWRSPGGTRRYATAAEFLQSVK